MADGPTSLWSSILAEASTSRTVAHKQILLCGHLHAGKQAILANFKDAPQCVNIDHSSPQSQLVAGLGYDYLDVKDPQDQETLARCSVYRLSKPSLPFLDIPLQPSNLSDTVALICLDGSKPETFLSDLVAWLSLLHQAAAQWTSKEPKQQQQQQQDPSSSEIKRQARPEYHLQMAQDRLSHIWTSYEEPAVKQGEHAGPSVPSSHGAGAPAELPQGALEANFGLQLVVVCTKMDRADALEKDRKYEEATFDYIQQTLRTICLKYGAALFFTSTHRPDTLAVLKEYVLNQIFIPPASTSQTASSDDQPPPPSQADEAVPDEQEATSKAAQTGASMLSKSFPFFHRANVVDRDALTVPAGWDSWGKIKVLRDTFEPSKVATGWSGILRPVLAMETGASVMSEQEEQEGGAAVELRHDWEKIVGKPKSAQDKAGGRGFKTVTPEQEFLRGEFEKLPKDKGDRNQASPSPSNSSPEPRSREHTGESNGRIGEAAGRSSKPSSRKAIPSASPDGAQPPGQNAEVLNNFFQGLLNQRKSSPAPTGKTSGIVPPPAPVPAPQFSSSPSPPPKQDEQ